MNNPNNSRRSEAGEKGTNAARAGGTNQTASRTTAARPQTGNATGTRPTNNSAGSRVAANSNGTRPANNSTAPRATGNAAGARSASNSTGSRTAASAAGARPTGNNSTGKRAAGGNSAGTGSPRPAASRKTGSSEKAKKPKKSRTNAPLREEETERAGGTAIASLVKAIIYIMSILVVSGFLSAAAIMVANDVFAFVKGEEEVTVTITDETDVAALGKILAEKGIIKYPRMFKLYAKLRGKDVALEGGEYTVNPSMNYDKLIATFAKSTSATRTEVVVVIPEGYTVDQIIDTLVNKYHLSSRADLTDAIQNFEFDYWFIDLLETNPPRAGRKYRLEGYLYPDTYYYYSDASASSILYKMLDNFDKKLKKIYGSDYQEELQGLCAEFGLSFDDIVILASMIQMEAKFDSEYDNISSVFHNRLSNPTVTNGKLESDATIQYFLDKHVTDLTAEQLKIDNLYNTYLYTGLPPGPISNPTDLAINYALYPAQTNYYFFVADVDGHSLFASTKAQHDKNVKTVQDHKNDPNYVPPTDEEDEEE